jgi:hypothetical protein
MNRTRSFLTFFILLAGAVPSAFAGEGDGPTVSIAPGRGFTVQTPDGSSAMTVRARLQMRDTVSIASETTNELAVKTVRLHIQGHIYTPELRYCLMLALGPADFDASPVFDAYVEYGLHRDLQIRAGQYFVPFDRARTNREYALQFVDRQQAISEINLDRDVGLTLLSSDLFGLGGRLAYALGVFGGNGKNRIGGEPFGFLYVGRLSYRPFGAFNDDAEGDLERLKKPRLAVGLAGAYNQDTRRQKSTTGNTLELGGFNYTHVAGDVVFKYAGFSFLGEVTYRHASSAFHDGIVDSEAVREWSRSGWGYLIQAGMMLTSKLELVARWDQLRSIGDTDPALVKLAREQGKELGGGVNLYLNGHALKLQADYTARFGAAEPSHLVRLQLDATF